ncbi:hypothetical protein K470DRAFT_256846 [Piedraia hortae CBS 480.64]|uniref:MalT-like TPR region domain-containing protein n=1 Tax=Piedraia hortae CBS 480.64 TaxID=1314780 RepID=A0A6A7C269_9PEZI|nr:hypothetical protein K470DRAFT_256846 [Piedraia hortae CBS 480.64]
MSGLSIALRAASTAQRYKAIPVFLDAITVLAVILNELQDFDAAIELLRAALPMLMESRQPRTQACITIGQSYVGLAGLADSEERRMHLMTLGEQYLDRAREFAMKLGDAEVNSQCLVMKLQMARYRGDDVAAAQVESLLA